MQVGHVKERNGIYIGRKFGQYKGSPLGNPFRIGKDGTREETIHKYRQWLWQQMQDKNSPVMAELKRLAAMPEDTKILCWCHPLPCHGDVVAKAVAWLRQQ